MVAWPSGLRRWFKAPVSSEAWVRIPPLPVTLFSKNNYLLVSVIFAYIFYMASPLWRNWLARSAVNRKVGGSSPPRGVNTFYLKIELILNGLTLIYYKLACVVVWPSGLRRWF